MISTFQIIVGACQLIVLWLTWELNRLVLKRLNELRELSPELKEPLR